MFEHIDKSKLGALDENTVTLPRSTYPKPDIRLCPFIQKGSLHCYVLDEVMMNGCSMQGKEPSCKWISESVGEDKSRFS